MAKTDTVQKTSSPGATVTTPTGGEAVKRSVVRTLGFSVLSFIYGYYWFYVTRTQLDKEAGSDRTFEMSPTSQLVLLIIPIVNIVAVFVFAYGMLNDVDRLRKKVGLEGIPVWVYLSAPVAASLLSWIPVIGWILAFTGLVVFGLYVSKLNEYYDKRSAGKAVDVPVSGGEIAVVVIGLILQILFFAFLFGALLVLIGLSNGSANVDVNTYRY